ncbi:MAG: hypothetical protein HKN65_10120 [Woeseiaceae bacterium]|nr:hypothetical protein [Woeseiaceae bacterium]
MKKILLAALTTVFLVFSAGASADMVANVYSCKLKEGKTSEDAHAINGEWLKWARAKAGTDDIRSSYTTSIVGDLDGFMWVDTYPDLAAWAKVNGADLEEENPELSEALDALADCDEHRLYNMDESEAAD